MTAPASCVSRAGWAAAWTPGPDTTCSRACGGWSAMIRPSPNRHDSRPSIGWSRGSSSASSSPSGHARRSSARRPPRASSSTATRSTKRALARYYVPVAPVPPPPLRDRGLTLDRYPNGTTGPHFWQKQIPAHAPTWVARWHHESRNPEESHTFIVADRVATLAWLANQAAIDLPPWTSRTDAPHRPTYALIDIDPGPRTTWEEVLVLARLYRAALGPLGGRG